MSIGLPGPIVTTEWLAAHLRDPDLVVVDASWYLPAMARDPRAEYLAGHIPGALFWDLDQLADPTNPLPHMLPPPATAGHQVGALGIADHHTVVVYDGSGTQMTAPRVWWHLRVIGHQQVAVLDGGLVKWRAESRPVEAGQVTRAGGSHSVSWRSDLVRDRGAVAALAGSERPGLVDARAAGRFLGRDPEPRPGVRRGHVPGAVNLPFTALVAADGTLLPKEELVERLRGAGVDLDRPVVASCGSGVTACVIALALEVVGHRAYAVYDGSWAEWGGRDDTLVESGPA